MITAEQIRGARAMLRMEQAELAAKAGVSVETVKRLERQSGPVGATAETISVIQQALRRAGVEFLDAGHGGPGVRLALDQRERLREHVSRYVASSFAAARELHALKDDRNAAVWLEKDLTDQILEQTFSLCPKLPLATDSEAAALGDASQALFYPLRDVLYALREMIEILALGAAQQIEQQHSGDLLGKERQKKFGR